MLNHCGQWCGMFIAVTSAHGIGKLGRKSIVVPDPLHWGKKQYGEKAI
jgi:hypothetical protein